MMIIWDGNSKAIGIEEERFNMTSEMRPLGKAKGSSSSSSLLVIEIKINEENYEGYNSYNDKDDGLVLDDGDIYIV